MRTKTLLAALICLASVAKTSAAASLEGVVVKVTPDTITVKGPMGATTYKVSNELLSNTIPPDNGPGLKGRFREVRKGCKILMEYENRGSDLVCVALEMQE